MVGQAVRGGHVDQLTCPDQRQRGGPGQRPREFQAGVARLARGDDTVRQPQGERLVSVNGTVRQQERHRSRGPERPGEKIGCAAVGRGADGQVARDEPRALAKHPDVRGQRDPQAGPDRGPLDRRHDGNLEFPDLPDRGVQAGNQRGEDPMRLRGQRLADQRQVGAGAEA